MGAARRRSQIAAARDALALRLHAYLTGSVDLDAIRESVEIRHESGRQSSRARALLLGIPVTVGMAGWGVWYCSAQIVDHEPLTDNAIGVVAVLDQRIADLLEFRVYIA